MAWYDMAWHDDDDDDDKLISWPMRGQPAVAEATPALPHEVDDRRSLHTMRTWMLWSRDVTAVEGWRSLESVLGRRRGPAPLVRPRPPQRSIVLPQSRVTWPLDRRRGKCFDGPAMNHRN